MGRLFLVCAAVGLLVAAGLVSLLGWWSFERLGAPLASKIGAAAVLLQLLVLGGAGLGVALLWRRVGQLKLLSDSPFALSHVMVVLIAAAADIGGLSFAASSLAAALLVALTGDQWLVAIPELAAILEAYSPGTRALVLALAALAVALGGLAMAAAGWFGLRFAGEMVLLTVRIGDDTRAIRARMERAAERR